MTENDDERSNAIDSAVLENYIHILIIIFIWILYFLFFKPTTFNISWCRPKKAHCDGELTACNGTRKGLGSKVSTATPVSPPSLDRRNVGSEFPRADEHGRVAGRNAVTVSVVKCTGHF